MNRRCLPISSEVKKVVFALTMSTFVGARTSIVPWAGVLVILNTKWMISGATTLSNFLEMVLRAPSSTSRRSNVMSTVVSPGT